MAKEHRRMKIEGLNIKHPVFCSRCGKEKKDVVFKNCEICRIYYHKYYISNREKEKIRVREWKRNNRKRFLEQKKIYRIKNRDKQREYIQTFYMKHPDYRNNYLRAYRHKERVYTKNEWIGIIQGG